MTKSSNAQNFLIIRMSFEPYKSRRREWGIYMACLGSERRFRKNKAQHDRNLIFFDAPVGMIFTIHRDLKIGSWLDFGMFLQNVMVLARSHGRNMPTNGFLTFIKPSENLFQLEMKISLWYGNRIRGLVTPENALIPDREPLENYISFVN